MQALSKSVQGIFAFRRRGARNTKRDHGGDAWHKDCGKSDVVQASTFDRRKIKTGIRLDRTSFGRRDDGRDHRGHGPITG